MNQCNKNIIVKEILYRRNFIPIPWTRCAIRISNKINILVD